MSCDYQWPLLDPNEEDQANFITHACRLDPDHKDEHQCVCGARPEDD